MNYQEIKDFISEKATTHAYFANCTSEYLNELSLTLEILQPSLKDLVKYLRDRLFIGREVTNQKMCIQALCELPIQRYLIEHYASTFEYEYCPSLNSDKDVDASFSIDGFRYNIEVKCPTYEDREKNDSPSALKVHISNVPNFADVLSDVFEGFGKQIVEKGNYSKVVNVKNMQNNVKDYLVSAQEKFNSNSTNHELNCLMLCCDDPMDLDFTYGYLYGHEGLFTSTSKFPPNLFDLVDIVVLTNLYNLHKKCRTDGRGFLYNSVFSSIHVNLKPRIMKMDAIHKLLTAIPSMTEKVNNFQTPGNAEENIKQVQRFTNFVGATKEYQDYFTTP